MLSGLHVIDLTAGGSLLCGRILAELGARVTRLEASSGRTGFGHIWGCAATAGLRAAFAAAGGLVEVVDLESAAGRRAVERLAGSADCLVETFRPGYLESIGLGFAALSAANPRLIMVSITGFGQSGPQRDWVSCNLTIGALGGQMHVTGEPGRPPLKLYGDQAEHLGVLFGVNGLLLALHQRNRTGRGQHVDVSLQECVAAALDHVLPRYFGDLIVAPRQGSRSWNGAFDILRCRGRHLLVYIPDERRVLTEWLAADGMAVGQGHQVNNPDLAMSVIGRWAGTRTAPGLFRKAQLLRLPWAPVLRPDELVKNRQLRLRGFFGSGRDGGGQVVMFPRAVPFLVSGVPSSIKGGASRLPCAGASRLPLSGIRILDFTWVMAGPYATRLMADFGAEVIKVQSHCVPGTEAANRTAYFKYWNRGKKGITLNMSQPEGIALARRLMRVSDVLIDSFSPRVMDNWGLGWDIVRQEKPDLIRVSMSAFGRTGPWRNYVAYGPTIHALSGLTYGTCYAGGSPLGPGFAFADHVAGLYASMAVMAALENRRRTGRGAFIDLSQFEAMCALTAADDNNPVAAPCGVYRCRGEDRWCAIAVFDDDEWCRLCRVMGMSHLLDHPRFAKAKSRIQNRAGLDRIIGEWTGRLTAEEVMTRLQDAGVCAGVVQDARDLAGDEQLKARGFFVNVADSGGRELVMDGTPVRLSSGRAFFPHGAPRLGEHNEYVFCGLLGMSREELADCVERRIIY